MNINNFAPSMSLYIQVRSGFVSQNSSLGAWCKKNKINMSGAKACLMGTWNGPKGQDLRAQIIEASGIADSYSEAV